MQIQQMFKADINRDINGVIKVQQDDERSIRQELEEYIITKELRKHFNTFFDHYEKALNAPTDKMGVWISGFFGSGKSHFLKILSYLLSNKVVAGKSSIEYFVEKFDDPMMFSRVENCSKPTTETILFNIDSKSPINKDKTAILRVFAKVFYEHLGFYGNDLKLAKLEKFVAKEGKLESFREMYLEIHGDRWEESRESYAFFEDDIVEVLQRVLGMSETSARNWFNGEESVDLDINQLTNEIRDYVKSKGKNFRLLFMIDEVGQYIGSDSDLMLNLQTIVEDIGTKCSGQVWVMVTSQEAIDQITKISGDDFSKIQGRFNTRLSLSSSSVDEVIKKRILAKNEDAQSLLEMDYAKNAAALKNLFVFSNSVLDMKGYSSEKDYSDTYPFVPYQFRLMQDVFVQIRKHGNSGKNLAGGERSMLSGFQEAAQKLGNKDEHALIPFYMFYDTTHTFLDGAIRRVIDRCEVAAKNLDGIEPRDVAVLKLLYLIRYIEDIKSNVENLATLMVDSVNADKIVLRNEIKESLERLLSQNYISRNGDNYMFLTDDEQDVEREIRNTMIDNSAIIQKIKETIFGDLYQTKKFNYGKYNFSFDSYVDDSLAGSTTGEMKLRICTNASDLARATEQELILRSQASEAIVVLSNDYPYYSEIKTAAQIQRYVMTKNVSLLPENLQNIIRNKNSEALACIKRAKEYLQKSIPEARFYAAGERLTIKAGSVQEFLDRALTHLSGSVYDKLDLIDTFYDQDSQIIKILHNNYGEQTVGEKHSPNAGAIKEVHQFMEIQSIKNVPTSMTEIQKRFGSKPYGWREIEIAAVVAALIADQKIAVKYCGSAILPTDKSLPDYLRKKGDTDKTLVNIRISPPEKMLRDARTLLSDIYVKMSIPTSEDDIIQFVTDRFTEDINTYKDWLTGEYVSSNYPGKPEVDQAISLLNHILSKKSDNMALLTILLEKRDELKDFSDDITDIRTFFQSQKGIYKQAQDLVSKLAEENDYLAVETDIHTAIQKINEILALRKPYNRIRELPELKQTVQQNYWKLVEAKKAAVLNVIASSKDEMDLITSVNPKLFQLQNEANIFCSTKEKEASTASSLMALDAMSFRIKNYCEQIAVKAAELLSTPPIGPGPTPPSIRTIHRVDIFPAKKLTSSAEIDNYVETVRYNLNAALKDNEGIILN